MPHPTNTAMKMILPGNVFEVVKAYLTDRRVPVKFKSSGATATLPRNSYNKVAYTTGGRLKTKVPRRKVGVGRLSISLMYQAIEWSTVALCGCLHLYAS